MKPKHPPGPLMSLGKMRVRFDLLHAFDFFLVS